MLSVPIRLGLIVSRSGNNYASWLENIHQTLVPQLLKKNQIIGKIRKINGLLSAILQQRVDQPQPPKDWKQRCGCLIPKIMYEVWRDLATALCNQREDLVDCSEKPSWATNTEFENAIRNTTVDRAMEKPCRKRFATLPIKVNENAKRVAGRRHDSEVGTGCMDCCVKIKSKSTNHIMRSGKIG